MTGSEKMLYELVFLFLFHLVQMSMLMKSPVGSKYFPTVEKQSENNTIGGTK